MKRDYLNRSHRLTALSLLVIGTLSLPIVAQSVRQPLTGRTMTLEECVRYAREHSPEMENAKTQIALIDRELLDAKLAFAPSISADLGGSGSFGRSQDKTGVYRDNSSLSSNAGISAGIQLFDGGARWYQLKSSRLAQESAPYVIKASQEQSDLQVIEAYINTLTAAGIRDVAKERLALSRKRLHEMEEQEKVGRASRSQLVELQTQVKSDELSLSDTEADYIRSCRVLAIVMGLDQPSTALTDSLPFALRDYSESEIIAQAMLAHPEAHLSVDNRPSVLLAENELKRSELTTKAARASLWPSISLGGGYGNSYYYTLGKEYRAFNQSFSEQIKANGRSYVSLSINIPIFQQGQIRSRIYRASLAELQYKNQLTQRKREEERNLSLALIDYEKAKEQYNTSKSLVGYAQESLKNAEIQYDAGRLSSYEWELAKNKDSEAKANMIRSLYGLLHRSIMLRYFSAQPLVDFTSVQR